MEKQSDFMQQFEQFFGEGEEYQKPPANKPDQSGSLVYQYNEEEEFFENLQLSGSFDAALL